jgi:hypothetical protein
MPLLDFVIGGISLDIMRCLVKELGADVNGARQEDGGTLLCAAAQIGNLAFLH